jgi:O-succinylbenzoate synthase
MKIDRMTLVHVRVPLDEPFRISNGVVNEKDGIFVSVYADGLTGCGEASPMEGTFYSVDTPESTWTYLRDVLVPNVKASAPQSVAEVNRILNEAGGNPFARAGVETAFQDLQARKEGVQLFRVLGGTGASVESGLAVGIYPSIPELLNAIERYMSDGYKRLKIKIQPGWDRLPLAEVRRRFGDIRLMVDANCAYGREDFQQLKSLDEFDLMMIEQPLPKEDLEGHAALQSIMETPVCLDESAGDLAAVRKAIALGSCRIINIKIQRVGGLSNAKAMHDLCMASGIPVWAGTMPELGLGGAQTLHLATLPGFRYPSDVQASRRWFEEDIIDPPIEVKNGSIQIPDGIGTCYELNTKRVRKYSVREESF